MLIFARKERPAKDHKITVVTGLRDKAQLRQAVEDKTVFAKHSSRLPYQKWLNLSPTGDWPMEVKTVDVPVLEKLKRQSTLGMIVKASFAVKLGSQAKLVHPYNEKLKKVTEIPFLKGHHICAFNLPEADEMTTDDEMIDVSKIALASDPSFWRDLRFYQENKGRADESGLGCYDYEGQDLVNNNTPSDTLCCFVPNIYVTLVSAVGNPLEVCANNSVVVLAPLKYSAHVIAAIINSRISRHYAFLLLRSSILLRRRAHWNPRPLQNLPLPDLKDAQAARLHQLAKEAATLSQGVYLNELDAYLDLISRSHRLTKVGFLGVHWSGEGLTVDRDDLVVSNVEGDQLQLGPVIVTGEPSALHLLRLSLLALDKDEIPVEDVQNVRLPGEAAERMRIVGETNRVTARLEETKQRMSDLGEEMDEIIAAGSGLTPRDHEVIRKRCQQFPLSVTVERPRYVWSPDRKRQARRIYEPGERFK
jgi:hypothetical protein